jgi:tRNA dimethylallyltransferase
MAPRIVDTIYIVGPTASGKTGLSLEIAQTLPTEIVCADSQTIRQDLDIGTAKPTQEERSFAPHHMLDIIGPYENYSVYDFQHQAKNIITDIHKRNKLAIIVGGTGLYIDSLYYDYQLSDRVINPDYHDELSGLSVELLQEMIIEQGIAMPPNDRNPRHLIGALLRSGINGQKGAPSERSIIVGINPGRDVVVDRINSRVESMFENGFIDEVRSVIEKYGQPPKVFDAIGYRIAARYLSDEITLDEAKELFKIADRQYAKRQMSWFNRNTNIHWFASPEEAKAYILEVC